MGIAFCSWIFLLRERKIKWVTADFYLARAARLQRSDAMNDQDLLSGTQPGRWYQKLKGCRSLVRGDVQRKFNGTRLGFHVVSIGGKMLFRWNIDKKTENAIRPDRNRQRFSTTRIRCDQGKPWKHLGC